MVYFKQNYIFLRFQRGSNILQERGSKYFRGGGGGGANVNIELVNFRGGGGRNSGSTHAYDRSTCFFSEANPERQVFSCNGSFSIVALHNMIRYMILDISSHTYRDFIWNKHALKLKLWEAEKMRRSCTYMYILICLFLWPAFSRVLWMMSSCLSMQRVKATRR